MNTKTIAACLITVGLLTSGCGPGQLLGPTITPSPTPTSTPTSTPTRTPTPVPTATLTPTPVPVCNPGNVVQGSTDTDLPGYMDIVRVSTTLEAKTLTVVFTLREIPEEITIDRDSLERGRPEIAWGVAVDTDNDPATGGENFLAEGGYGYEYILQAFNFKQGAERKGSIENLFRLETHVWKVTAQGISSVGTGKIDVDTVAKTITLSGNIGGITPESYLHFFSFLQDTDPLSDQICRR